MSEFGTQVRPVLGKQNYKVNVLEDIYVLFYALQFILIVLAPGRALHFVLKGRYLIGLAF